MPASLETRRDPVQVQYRVTDMKDGRPSYFFGRYFFLTHAEEAAAAKRAKWPNVAIVPEIWPRGRSAR